MEEKPNSDAKGVVHVALTPLYAEPVFQDRNFFAGGVWPAEQIAGKSYDYREINCPNADLVLKTSIRLTLHEGFAQNDVEDYVRAIRKIALRTRR